MEKLIITVAGDSRTSYPHNNLCPPQEDIAACAQQYVDAAKAGAAISHIHGRRTLEETIQADGKMVSRIHHADWKKLHHMITDKVDTIMQYGVASARIEEKIELMKLGPDMMAVAFNAHDEYFQPVPTLAAEAHDGDPPGRGADRLCQGRRGAQRQAGMRMLPDRRVLASRFRPQGRLPEEADLRHAVHRLAGRHLDAADRARAAVLRRQPAAGRASGTSA